MVAEAKAKAPKAKPRTWRGTAVAEKLPVARVLVNKGVLHLDRLFDYAVPAELSEAAQPGVRVRVRFGAGGHRVHGGRREGGGLIDGFIVERRADSDYGGALAALAQVVSPEVVLGPRMLALARAVADRYAGSVADVLQLALPPRSARAEAKPSPEPLPPPAVPEPGGWTRYGAGPAFLRALATGGTPRAVWTALPGPGWADELARAMAATLASGRGALAVVPDGRTAARVDTALTALLGEGRHALLTADSGPEKRYRQWLAVSRGSVRAVVGTRAAMFAPVRDLGLVAVWDDGDSSHGDIHAPFPHFFLGAGAAGRQRRLRLPGREHQLHRLRPHFWWRPAGLFSLVADRETVRAAAPRIRTVRGRAAGPGRGFFARRGCRIWSGRPCGRA
ncbi:primosome assembly protein PriA [Streptomyces sp. C]|nr:primosome assembly protein PriA [Streptomyces sp. C]